MEDLQYKSWQLMPSSLLVAPFEEWQQITERLRACTHPADYYGPLEGDFQQPNVASVQAIRSAVSTTPNGIFRVVVIPFAHQLSKEVANALLKLLEEPPPQTYIVLLAEHAHLLPTVRSRVSVFQSESKAQAQDDDWMRAVSSTDLSTAMGRQRAQRLQIYYALRHPGLKTDTILEPFH